MSTTKAHRKFVSNLLGTSGSKNIQPCINGKTLSLDFVRKPGPKQEHRVIPSRKYTSAGEVNVPYSVADNPLAQHLHHLAMEAMKAPNEHVEDIESTQSQQRPRKRSARANRVVAFDDQRQRGARDRRNNVPVIKQEPSFKPHAANTETTRTKLGNKTKYITRVQSAITHEQQQMLAANKRVPSGTVRTARCVHHESAQQPTTAVNVSNGMLETPVTPCTRSCAMFAGSTPVCELTRDSSQRPQSDRSVHPDRSKLDDDTCPSSEMQSDRTEFDSSPMVLTSGWSSCHSATDQTEQCTPNPVPDTARDQTRDSCEDTPPATFKWHVIESLARDHVSPSPPQLPEVSAVLCAELDDESATPKQRAIQRLFQQNSYLKRRVRDLTQHLLRANKNTFL
jgi:hypothetical protein